MPGNQELDDSGPAPGAARERGRAAFAARAWEDAFAALACADRESELDSADLERLVLAAALCGRGAESLGAHERLYHRYLEAQQPARAARAAFWITLSLQARGELGRAGGWLARGQRLLERAPSDCVEQGYGLLPVAQQHLLCRELEQVVEPAARAATIGERFGDGELFALARNFQGRALLMQGRVREGLPFIDEAMLAALDGGFSPLVTGLVYCNAIAACQELCAVERSREWTAALAEWCDAQPQLTMFTGACRVHRAQIHALHGNWPEAITEARRGARHAAAEASYQEAEIHRLRGELASAEEAYRRSSDAGGEPQPGLALLRLAEGRTDVAASGIRRALEGTREPLQRTRLLPAAVEVFTAAGQNDEAARHSAELSGLADQFDSEMLRALADEAQATLAIATGDPAAALAPLRRAFASWQRVAAPYLAARVRVRLAEACRALGDEDGFRLELEAARACFARLGATTDLARADAMGAKQTAPTRPRGLTERELEVLRLVATGKTNKAIAQELSLSEKTVDRHVSNIFSKLDVASRAAATAFAYEHGLV